MSDKLARGEVWLQRWFSPRGFDGCSEPGTLLVLDEVTSPEHALLGLPQEQLGKLNVPLLQSFQGTERFAVRVSPHHSPPVEVIRVALSGAYIPNKAA